LQLPEEHDFNLESLQSDIPPVIVAIAVLQVDQRFLRDNINNNFGDACGKIRLHQIHSDSSVGTGDALSTTSESLKSKF
jgi:hypothetical protein